VAVLSLFHAAQEFSSAPKFLAELIWPYGGRGSPEADKVATAEMSASERKADLGLGCLNLAF